MAYTAVYSSSDLGTMLIDIVEALFNGLASNAGTIAVLLVVALIAVLAVDALTGIFGIFRFMRRK